MYTANCLYKAPKQCRLTKVEPRNPVYYYVIKQEKRRGTVKKANKSATERKHKPFGSNVQIAKERV